MQKRNEARRTSIVDSFHKPAFRAQVLINAIQRGLVFAAAGGFRLCLRAQRSCLDVPLLACPRGFRPPVAFSSPRPSERKDLPAHTFATEECRLSVLKVHRRG